ncbi:MAG: VacJ family lipoprotein [Zoogloeaceae bacterium]|nr:VacJ family lipoprotein [Zoogloeaceae bacterium]
MCLKNCFWIASFLSLLFLSGCAAERAPSAQDPFEGFNRAMFAVHERIDSALLKPAAQGYDALTPLPVKTGAFNFFDNFRDIGRGGNAFLQGKGQEGLSGWARFLINSTVGLFGVFDVASEMDVSRGDADFGQTLGVWGVSSGPYLFVPLAGPFTGRDLAGFAVDQSIDPLWRQVEDHPALRNSLLGLSAVQARARLLPADRVLEEASLDKYAYLRAAYLQRRAAQIRGETALNEDEEDNDDSDLREGAAQ